MSYVGRNFNLNSVVSFPVGVSVSLHDVVGFNDVLGDELIVEKYCVSDSHFVFEVIRICVPLRWSWSQTRLLNVRS